MTPPADDLRDRIKALYPDLSPALKKVAKIALDDPLEITLQPLRRVAERSGAGTTSLIRFARLLGFGSYGAFRDGFRSELRRSQGVYSQRGAALLARTGGEALLADTRASAEAGLANSFASNAPDLLDRISRRLVEARQVYVIGLRSAYAPAFYFHYLLSMMRSGVRLVENRHGMLAEEISDAGSGDVSVAISFEPYTQGTIETTRLLKEAGTSVIAISDSSASPLASLADDIIEVQTSSPSFYISFTPLTCMLEALAALAALQAGNSGVAALQQGDDARGRPGTYWDADGHTKPGEAAGRARGRRTRAGP